MPLSFPSGYQTCGFLKAYLTIEHRPAQRCSRKVGGRRSQSLTTIWSIYFVHSFAHLWVKREKDTRAPPILIFAFWEGQRWWPKARGIEIEMSKLRRDAIKCHYMLGFSREKLLNMLIRKLFEISYRNITITWVR